jgi:hypothetical protein
MSDFDDFWTAIYSPSMPISDESRDALKAAMAVIYNSTNTDAVRIITALRNAGRPIDFFASSSSGWSTTVSLFRITVPQQGGDLVTVKSFNTVIEPVSDIRVGNGIFRCRDGGSRSAFLSCRD